jgi:hypothetical protein
MDRSPTATTAHNVLLVPMQMDAFCLSAAENKREALADFTKVPFTYKDTDDRYKHSSDRANISEHVVSPAFSSGFHELGAGIHLHWALPDALSRSVESDLAGRHRFPVITWFHFLPRQAPKYESAPPSVRGKMP